jgi:hypothetical protein
MNKRDIVIGFVIFSVVALIIFWSKKPRVTPVETPTPTPEVKLEEKFNYEIPEDSNKIDLTDVSGGVSRGIATRSYKNGRFEHVILADIPDPDKGYFYQGWLTTKGKEGEEGFSYVKTGKLRVAKGGYLLEFQSSRDYTSFSQVWVTLEKTDDTKPEKHILEGSF